MATTATSVAMHWIDGEWVDSEEHRDSVNPATGETIGSYAMGTPEEAHRAIDAAKRAFNETAWRTDRALRSPAPTSARLTRNTSPPRSSTLDCDTGRSPSAPRYDPRSDGHAGNPGRARGGGPTGPGVSGGGMWR